MKTCYPNFPSAYILAGNKSEVKHLIISREHGALFSGKWETTTSYQFLRLLALQLPILTFHYSKKILHK